FALFAGSEKSICSLRYGGWGVAWYMMMATYRKYRYFVQAAALTMIVLLFISAVYYFVQRQREDYDTRKAKIRPAPEVSLSDAEGKKHNLKQAIEPGIVVIWASWCGPCKEELRKLEKTDLVDWSYTAINADEKRQDALDFLKKERIRKPLVLFDPESQLVPVQGYPTIYATYGDGTWAGPLTHTDFDSLLKEIRHTLNRTEYKPYKASKAANERFWQSAYWQLFRYVSLTSASLYFAALLLLVWRILPTSRILVAGLIAHFVISTTENLGFLRLADIVQLRGTVGNIISLLYYWPFVWGGIIALGILQYMHREIRQREGAPDPDQKHEPAVLSVLTEAMSQKTPRYKTTKSRRRVPAAKVKKRTGR
ncbi:MAG TPA: TlpA disulfide reductase family protein, partial [Turneriella sp.]|nr:TlpA disulfide reductase family protein [Turneriella sp.]